MCVVCMYAHMCVWERLLAHVGACRGQRLTSGFLLCCSLPWLFFEILKGFLKKIPCMCACSGNVPVNISARRVQKRILGPLEQQSQMVLSQWCGCRALNLCPLEEQTSALEPWASLHPLLFVLLRETLTEPISRAGWPSVLGTHAVVEPVLEAGGERSCGTAQSPSVYQRPGHKGPGESKHKASLDFHVRTAHISFPVMLGPLHLTSEGNAWYLIVCFSF